KSVLGVMVAAEHPAAHAQHHWAMTPHQDSEGCLVLVLNERVQQLTICHASPLGQDGTAKTVDEPVGVLGRHQVLSRGGRSFFSSILEGQMIYRSFWRIGGFSQQAATNAMTSGCSIPRSPDRSGWNNVEKKGCPASSTARQASACIGDSGRGDKRGHPE